MHRVVGVGELLWDLLPAGKQIGGAPANFAYHASALGARAMTISRVASDALGRELLAQLDRVGVNIEGIQIDEAHGTGTVAVAIDVDGQPKFDIIPDVAWDHLAVTPVALHAAALADAICFGTLAQRAETSRDAIHTIVAAAPSDALRVLDVNLRQQFHSRAILEQSLALATVLKVNDAELPVLAEMFALTGGVRAQMEQIAERWQLRAVALTRGGQGSALLTAHDWSEHAGVPVRVADTIGAGDAFTAAMTLGLLAGWSLRDVNAAANEVAAYVASQGGATPALPPALVERFVMRG